MRVRYDYDQGGWGSQRRFADGDLDGLWVPDKFVIHYGGNPNFAGDEVRCLARGYSSFPSEAAEMAVLRIYEQSHLSRGWRAIGYNYAVGQSGAVYRLRGDNPSGATSGDYEGDGIRENAEAVAILAILGGDQEPSEAMLASISEIINDNPDLRPVIGHRDVKGTTSCPGTFLLDWVHTEQWKEEPQMNMEAFVQAAFASGHPNLRPADETYWVGLARTNPNDPEFFYLWRAVLTPVPAVRPGDTVVLNPPA